MEENVNFDNEVLAYLTIRKVFKTINIDVCFVGSTNWEPQAVYPGPSGNQRGSQRFLVSRSASQTCKRQL